LRVGIKGGKRKVRRSEGTRAEGIEFGSGNAEVGKKEHGAEDRCALWGSCCEGNRIELEAKSRGHGAERIKFESKKAGRQQSRYAGKPEGWEAGNRIRITE